MLHPSVIAAILLIPLTSPAIAQNVTPYGGGIDNLYAIASRAQDIGDFDTAIINYRRAQNLARNLASPILRTCGVAGAEARIQGGQAAKDYLTGQVLTPQALITADRIFEEAFRSYWQEFDIQHPELISRCP
jgi:hypothetical protein